VTRQLQSSSRADSVQLKADADRVPGANSLTVQMEATMGGNPAEAGAEQVQQTAAEGLEGASGALPHGDAIQAAFGDHDLSGVQAAVGGEAGQAADAMGAAAYTAGDGIAFSETPDLHTAAHEAAHVVQQAAGLAPEGGVGTPGDELEQHADAVADTVVAGESAKGLLDDVAGQAEEGAEGAETEGEDASVQMKAKAVQFDIESDLRGNTHWYGDDADAIITRFNTATAAEQESVLDNSTLMTRLFEDFSAAEKQRFFTGMTASLLHRLRSVTTYLPTYFWTILSTATPAERLGIPDDPAIMTLLAARSVADRNRILGMLGITFDKRLEVSLLPPWNDTLHDTLATAPSSELMDISRNPALLTQLDGMSDGPALRGTMAIRVSLDAANDVGGWIAFIAGTTVERTARLLGVGDEATQRLYMDRVIRAGSTSDVVEAAFQSYWDVDMGVIDGATSWPLATLKFVHNNLKRLPDQDTRALVHNTGSRAWNLLTLTSDPLLIDRAAFGGGEFTIGSNASIDGGSPYGHSTGLAQNAARGATTLHTTEPGRFSQGDTIALDRSGPNRDVATITAITGNDYTISTPLAHAHQRGEQITPDDGTARHNTNWLAATIRHEIAHSVETALGGVSGFNNTIGGWWVGGDDGANFTDWAAAMGPDAWTITNDTRPAARRHAVTPAEKLEIEAEMMTAVAGRKTLHAHAATLPRANALRVYLPLKVQVIEAAESCMKAGDNFWQNQSNIKAFNGKRFSVSWWYKRFQYHNEVVVTNRVADYQLYAPAEFFAEAYTVFYEEAGMPGITEEMYGRLIRDNTQKDWIKEHIHNRGHAPAGTAPAPTGTGTPGPAPATEGAEGGGESAPQGGGAVPGGAGFGKHSNNPDG
jgi:hypothetical protein